MDWVEEAKRIFNVDRPLHFTNYKHCCECAEHDVTLQNKDIDTISINELGKPGWDPICFCSVIGKKYYFPALVRLTIDTMEDEFYLDQFLFHLIFEGVDNNFYKECSVEQKEFIASFIEYLITDYDEKLDYELLTEDALKAHEIWSTKLSSNPE